MIGQALSATHVLMLVGVLFGAVAQSATGMGFSLVAAPVLILHLGPREGVAATVMLAALSSVVPLLRDGRHIRPLEVTRLLAPMLLCTPLLAAALRGVDTDVLAMTAGAGVVVAVGVLASGIRWSWLRRPSGAVATSGASAFLNVIGGVGGPPIGLYAANSDWEPATVRANLHGVFIVQNIATSLVLGMVFPDAFELLALALGTIVGMVLAPRIPTARLRVVVLGLSLVGGIALISRAL
ncbi:TSUP family transporter [Nocardia sp. MW-W600-9]